jgi:pimeloyl-ACP methyl ester carboxylesterase
MPDAQPTHPSRAPTRLRLLAVLTFVVALLAGAVGAATPGTASGDSGPKPTIVLVHGAFADASGWNDVTERLQDRGYAVLATANPLRSVASDSAYLRSILDTIEGPIVLVGHSYGGFVLTNAAVDHPGVQALVYIAAFAPDVAETVGGLSALNPGSLLGPETLVVRPHPGGADGYINPAVFRDIFAADLPRHVTDVMAASQRPADVGTLFQPSGPPAWETIPSWYVVASQDHTIPPATQRFMAQRAEATTVEIRSSHVVMMSHPEQVTAVIEQAAAVS